MGTSILALAALGLGIIAARGATTDAPCPPVVSASFADNGAAALLAGRSGARGPLRILAIGSSSTLGVGASSPGHAYPAQLAAELTSRWGIPTEVRNAGVGGEICSATLARLRAELAADRPDLVLWQVGTNDAVTNVAVADFRADLEAGIAASRARGASIILVDPQLYEGVKNIKRLEEFVDAVREVGAEMHAPVFSRFAMMKAWAESSAAVLRASLSSDGFHMDDQGYACFARALAGDIAARSAASAQTGSAGGSVANTVSGDAAKPTATRM